MADDINDFFGDFDHYSREVSRSRHQDYARLLRQWLRTLEQAPEPLRSRIAWLKKHFPAERLEKEVILQGRGMVGSGKLNWPEDVEDRLSSQLMVLEAMTEKEDSPWQFGINFFPVKGSNINDIISEMSEHLFEPHVRELRRYLERNASKPLDVQLPPEVPASDRIVRIDHNQPAYSETILAIEDAAGALIGDNNIGPDDRDRIKFELDSGILLLKAQTARLSAIETVLVQALRWLSQNFAGAALGIAAERALLAVISLIGGG